MSKVIMFTATPVAIKCAHPRSWYEEDFINRTQGSKRFVLDVQWSDGAREAVFMSGPNADGALYNFYEMTAPGTKVLSIEAVQDE